MQFTARQIKQLRRYPRAVKVWARQGITLTPRMQVLVTDQNVRVVRPTAKQ